ncbi:MAG: aminomethyl-transferring glycine dehydrogenase subunit GcvPA [Thermoplasmata archaeon]
MASTKNALLEFLGLGDVDALFTDIPPELRVEGLDLPHGLSEAETVQKVSRILERNRTTGEMTSYLGAGYYDTYVPSLVDAILARSEFYTSYTPYQAELSQGLLQALFEFQSLVCELTGMAAANSSMYDASTALGEAALMAHRITGKGEIVIPVLLSEDKKAVLANYAQGPGLRVREAGYDEEDGTLDFDHLGELVGKDTAAVYVEVPNYLGQLDAKVPEVRAAFPDALLIVGIHPLAQAVVRPPGDYGADIVIGEGQALGGWMNFGGPSLGLFACRRDHIRKMPGRVIGLTKDLQGARAFTMTLQTREQHIRKGRAMSNICTNESLLAVGAAVYLAYLGARGLRALAGELMDHARDLMGHIDGVSGFRAPLFPGSYFNEFPVGHQIPHATLQERLMARGLSGGVDLSPALPQVAPASLFAVTDRHTLDDFQELVRALEAPK